MTLLERAARAADPGAWLVHDRDKSWGWAEQRVRRSLGVAHAVLLAVRNEAHELHLVGDHAMREGHEADGVFIAMIDAILNEQGAS